MVCQSNRNTDPVTYRGIGHAQIDGLLQEATDERHGGPLESACKQGRKERSERENQEGARVEEWHLQEV